MIKPGDIVTISTHTDRWRPMGIIAKIEKQGSTTAADVFWVRNGRITRFDLNNLVEY